MYDFVIRSLAMLFFAGWVFVATGCGPGASSSGGASSPSVALDTPEALARYIHKCMLEKDYEAYRKACFTREDFKAMITLIGDDPRGTARLKEDLQNFETHESEVKANFDEFVQRMHTHGLHDASFLSDKPLPKDIAPPAGLEVIPSVNIHLANDHIINIESIAKINGRWVSGSDDTLNYFTFGAKPHHHERKFAEGYTIKELGVELPETP